MITVAGPESAANEEKPFYVDDQSEVLQETQLRSLGSLLINCFELAIR